MKDGAPSWWTHYDDTALNAKVAGIQRNLLDLFISDNSSIGSSDEETFK